MKCPFCNAIESKVIDSRPADDGSVIRRRRECTNCFKRFTTYEKTENIPLMIIKKDGNRECYDRNKIMSGVLKACEKRPVSVSQIQELVDRIEKKIFNTMDREICSTLIGELIMKELKSIDEVSYVRFASVYRQFRDINTFMDELNKLLKEK